MGELWNLNVPVKNNANRFSLQKAVSIRFYSRRMNPHYGGLVDLKSKNFHITISSTCAPIADLNLHANEIHQASDPFRLTLKNLKGDTQAPYLPQNPYNGWILGFFDGSAS